MAQKPEHDKKQKHPVLRFFAAIVAPAIFVICLVILILTIGGVDVVGWAQEQAEDIPVVASIIPADSDAKSQHPRDEQRNNNDDSDDKIASLNDKITALEAEIDDLKQDLSRLEHEETDETSANEAGEQTSGDDAVAAIASSLSDMDNEQAARVLQAMEQDLAVTILEELSNDARSDIFDAMEADYAATLSTMFVEQTE